MLTANTQPTEAEATRPQALILLTPEQRAAATPEVLQAYIDQLEKAYLSYEAYIPAYRQQVKVLNRRNTMAIVELQGLVAAFHAKYPEVAPEMLQCEDKLKAILDFRTPYAPAN